MDVGTITQTDFGYTGQRNLDAQGNSFSLGLLDREARFYDPSLGRFTQPDTLTPGGPQGLDRYRYILNNPVNGTDPSGHKCLDVDPENQSSGCSIGGDGGIATSIQSDFGIIVSGSYTRFEAQVILKSMKLMETGMNYLTGGYGEDWIKKNLSGVTIHVGTDAANIATQIFDPQHLVHNVSLGSTVSLVTGFENYDWESPDYRVDTMIIHELGHIVDDRSSNLEMGDLIGSGVGDQLMAFVGGKAESPLIFWQGSLSISPANAFQPGKGWDYGNSAPAEYFAQTFAGTIYSPYDRHLPIAAYAWMSAFLNRTR